MKNTVTFLLNLFLGLFLADAVLSLADDTLILFLDIHVLTVARGIVALFALLMAILIYVLMGLTPMIPKRQFLPLTLFNPVGMVAVIPFCIWYYSRIQLVYWVLSLSQVFLGLGVLCWLQGGVKFRPPWFAEARLGARLFSWLNLVVFLLANVFVLPAAVVLYLGLCLSLAVDHFSDGFLALHPDGLTVEVRKYVRDDGKRVHLIPMAHIGQAEFYRRMAESFPSNSIILMEGVTDGQGRLTNELSYQRMAKSVGLAEQEQEFQPTRGEMVHADVDVEQFSPATIDFLNLAALMHSKGLRPEVIMQMLQYSSAPHFEQQLLEDVLRKRNRRVLQEIEAQLPKSDNIVVPWGVAHMPGIAEGIRKSGFGLEESREYQVIRFRGPRR